MGRTISGSLIPEFVPECNAGRIWRRLLTRASLATLQYGTDVLLHLDHPDAGGTYVGLVGTTGTTYPTVPDGVPEPAMIYPGTNDYASTADRVAGATHLFLLKMQMNMAGGYNDGCDLWVDPPLFAGEPGLGLPIYSHGYADVFGTNFSGVGVSFNKPMLNLATPKLDDIRISNGPNGLAEVMSGTTPAPPRFTSIVAAGDAISMEIADLTPGLTNKLQRGPDIATGTWSSVHSFVALGPTTNWSETASNVPPSHV